MENTEKLYAHIALSIEIQIRTGALKTGEKLLSVRKLSQERNVSAGTIVKAYFELEKKQLIESRPQSGYYVSFAGEQHRNHLPGLSAPARSEGSVAEIYYTIFNNRAIDIDLSSNQIAEDLLPASKLAKELISSARNLHHAGARYNSSGNFKLKTQVAKRSLTWGGNLKPDDIIPTSGAMDALTLSLTSLLKRGDTIAVESPVNFGIINLAQTFGFRLLELPTDPEKGIDIPALKKAIERGGVDLCLLMGNYSNPFGSCMPAGHQKEIVKLLAFHDIPLVEDDVFGALFFYKTVQSYCKTFDETGNVLFCSSVSKFLAGGYRVGWIAPGKYKDKIIRSKPYHPQTCNSLTHEAVARFMESNGYDHYLKGLRQTLYINALKFQRAIREYFPADIKFSQPKGGIHLWLELGKDKEAIKLYNKALANKIGITPGRMYTMHNQFNNCFTLNFSLTLNEEVRNALSRLGKYCSQL